MLKILLVGFDNAPGSERNSAWDFVSCAADFCDEERFVQSVKLPLLWDGSFQALVPTILQGWDSAILFGNAPHTSIAIERLALNESDVSLKDAAGRRPKSKTVIAGDEPGYWTDIPYRDLTINLTESGVPAFASHHAGGFVANHVFYQMMHWIQRDHPGMMGGLIQIPENFAISGDLKKRALSCILDTVAGTVEESSALSFDISKLRRASQI
ncbi:MAG: hypothetical protein AAGB46_10590 [Verrucomicrobiota bacterium]